MIVEQTQAQAQAQGQGQGQQQQQRALLPPHPIGESGQRYLATLGEKEMALHLLAVERLGSSYFVEKSLGFRKWWAATAPATATVAPPS